MRGQCNRKYKREQESKDKYTRTNNMTLQPLSTNACAMCESVTQLVLMP